MSKRSAYFDNVKFVLIVLVVIGHVVNRYLSAADSGVLWSIKTTLWVFHMPAFLFVSGLFAKGMYKPERGLKVNTLTFYLVLYVLFYCGIYAVQCTYGDPTFDLFATSSIPWYLFALAVLGASLPLVAKVKLGPRLVIPASVALAVASGFSQDFGDFLSLGRIVNFAPFYYAGYFMPIDRFENAMAKARHNKALLLGSIAVLAAALAFVALGPDKYVGILAKLAPAHTAYADCGNAPLWVIAAMRAAWFPVAALLGVCTCILVPAGKSIVSDLGSRTLQVYILHPFVYLPLGGFGVMKAYAALNVPFADVWVLVFAVALAFLLALPAFPMKFFMWIKGHIRIEG